MRLSSGTIRRAAEYIRPKHRPPEIKNIQRGSKQAYEYDKFELEYLSLVMFKTAQAGLEAGIFNAKSNVLDVLLHMYNTTGPGVEGCL